MVNSSVALQQLYNNPLTVNFLLDIQYILNTKYNLKTKLKYNCFTKSSGSYTIHLKKIESMLTSNNTNRKQKSIKLGKVLEWLQQGLLTYWYWH